MNRDTKYVSATTYKIEIQGHLPASWSDRLGGMEITSLCKESSPEMTILRGQLPDQAALFGVLNALYDMRFTLISVTCLKTMNEVFIDESRHKPSSQNSI